MSNKALTPQGGKTNSLQAALDLVATGQPAFCLHQAWGIGVIRSYDEAAKRLLIDFPEQNKKGHAMDVAFFLGKIEFITPNGVVAKAYAEAAEAYVRLLTAHETSPRAPEGLVKLARSMRLMGEKARACEALGQMKTRFPKASEAARTLAAAERSRAGC